MAHVGGLSLQGCHGFTNITHCIVETPGAFVVEVKSLSSMNHGSGICYSAVEPYTSVIIFDFVFRSRVEPVGLFDESV
ncbi:hypothetical protein BW11_11450 [Bifidobacterium sp. UTCIF-38]|nr:hypothetical protein BW11_11450 [Bifidobacterium sp. UTCIF-38]